MLCSLHLSLLSLFLQKCKDLVRDCIESLNAVQPECMNFNADTLQVVVAGYFFLVHSLMHMFEFWCLKLWCSQPTMLAPKFNLIYHRMNSVF